MLAKRGEHPIWEVRALASDPQQRLAIVNRGEHPAIYNQLEDNRAPSRSRQKAISLSHFLAISRFRGKIRTYRDGNPTYSGINAIKRSSFPQFTALCIFANPSR